jgi:hypothetical protein
MIVCIQCGSKISDGTLKVPAKFKGKIHIICQECFKSLRRAHKRKYEESIAEIEVTP